MTFFAYAISTMMILLSIVWLGISLLILYNLYHYTIDKRNIKKDLPMWLAKYKLF